MMIFTRFVWTVSCIAGRGEMTLDLAGEFRLTRGQNYVIAGLSLLLGIPTALVIDLFMMVLFAPFIVGGWVVGLVVDFIEARRVSRREGK